MRRVVFIFPALVLLGGACSSIPFQTRETAQCTYQNARYSSGESFPAGDGCNSCTCGQDGNVACTKVACDARTGLPVAQCQTNADCETQNLDKSFCDQGSWECVNATCELRCDVSSKVAQ